MKILILGGTIFVGRHFVDLTLRDGHEVTMMHRGKRGADVFPEVERILADRDGGLAALGNREWDAVVDCCGYVPRVVRQSAEALRSRVGRYVFISSVSVYKGFDAPGINESADVGVLEDPTIEEITAETYGPLKALCEQEVDRVFGNRGVNIRPGIITGPYDPSNRFTHWVERIGNESPVLVPALTEQPVQLIDARDLGAWILHGLKTGFSGSYNAAGPESPRTFGDMIHMCHSLNPKSELVWIGSNDLATNELSLWKDLPLTMPTEPAEYGLMQVDNRKAVSAGLTFRPWAETAKDVLDWVRGDEPKPTPTHGLERSKELRIIRHLTARL